MLRSIFGAVVGFIVGAMFGAGVSLLIHLGQTEAMGPDPVPLRIYSLLSQGLVGGGFGAITGAIIGATGAVLRALKALSHEPPPPPAR